MKCICVNLQLQIIIVTHIKKNHCWEKKLCRLISILCYHEAWLFTHSHWFWWNFLRLFILTQKEIIDAWMVVFHHRCHGNGSHIFGPKIIKNVMKNHLILKDLKFQKNPPLKTKKKQCLRTMFFLQIFIIIRTEFYFLLPCSWSF